MPALRDLTAKVVSGINAWKVHKYAIKSFSTLYSFILCFVVCVRVCLLFAARTAMERCICLSRYRLSAQGARRHRLPQGRRPSHAPLRFSRATDRQTSGPGLDLHAASPEGEQDPAPTSRPLRRPAPPPPRSARSSGSGWRAPTHPGAINIGRDDPVSDAESESGSDVEDSAAVNRASSPDARAAASAVLRGIRADAKSLSHQLVNDGHLARARLHFALDRLQTPREPPCKITQMRGRIPRPPHAALVSRRRHGNANSVLHVTNFRYLLAAG